MEKKTLKARKKKLLILWNAEEGLLLLARQMLPQLSEGQQVCYCSAKREVTTTGTVYLHLIYAHFIIINIAHLESIKQCY